MLKIEDATEIKFEINGLRSVNKNLMSRLKQVAWDDDYRAYLRAVIGDETRRLSDSGIPELELEVNKLTEQIQSLQANINSKQQSINSLTSENRMQAEKINSLQLVSTCYKILENEFKSIKGQLKDATEHNQLLNQKMENQRAQLKNLNTKSNQISVLNTEISKLKLDVNQLTGKIEYLKANIISKQQSINSLTSANRIQSEEINSLQLVSSSNKTLENELKSTKYELKDVKEQNQLLKRRIENQKTELKNLNTKSNQVSALNSEISKLKKQLEEKKKIIRDGDNELYTSKKKISDLEQEMDVYKEIVSDLDNCSKIELVEDSSKECTICCEVFSEDRKKVAYGPCGHNIACAECSQALLRKTAANAVRGQKQDCPICRSEIKSILILEGIY